MNPGPGISPPPEREWERFNDLHTREGIANYLGVECDDLIDAIYGKPVQIFFLLVAPPQDKRNVYLPLLGKIAELVKEKEIRDRLAAVEHFDELREVLEEKFGHE